MEALNNEKVIPMKGKSKSTKNSRTLTTSKPNASIFHAKKQVARVLRAGGASPLKDYELDALARVAYSGYHPVHS